MITALETCEKFLDEDIMNRKGKQIQQDILLNLLLGFEETSAKQIES